MSERVSEARRAPFVIGVTGPIGCGKSHVVRVLQSFGAAGIDADIVAHEVMAPGGPAYEPVLERFGRQLAGPGGQIDRAALGRRVFSDRQALAELEAIVHPAVGRAIRQQVEASTAPAVVLEAIKLLEAGLSRALCDEVWVTSCSAEEQYRRLAVDRGMPIAEVERRRAAQMPVQDMAAQADRLIDTNGPRAATALFLLGAWREIGLPVPQPEVWPAGSAEEEGIATLRAEAGAECRGLPEPDGELVAAIGGACAGWLGLWPAPAGHTCRLYVAQAARRCGAGTAMLRAAARMVTAPLRIPGDAAGPPGGSFFKKLGFAPAPGGGWVAGSDAKGLRR